VHETTTFLLVTLPCIHRFQLWGKVGETETVGSFIPLGMQYPWTDVLRMKQRENRLCMVLAQGVFKIFGRQKIKNQVSDISPICPLAIACIFGMPGDIAD